MKEKRGKTSSFYSDDVFSIEEIRKVASNDEGIYTSPRIVFVGGKMKLVSLARSDSREVKMKERKFRGKRVDTDKWVFGSLLICGEDYYIVTRNADLMRYDNENHLVSNICDVRAETVGQYIGRKDKNRKEIYEGDIMSGYDPNGEPINPFVVSYDPNSCAVVFEMPPCADKDFTAIGWAIEDGFKLKIIGNIHENPELVEV